MKSLIDETKKLFNGTGQYKQGVGFVIPEAKWYQFPAVNGFVGRVEKGKDAGQFVAPLDELESVIQKASGPTDLEKALSLPPKALSGSRILLVKVLEPYNFDIRAPNSNSSGANDQFIPGGKTAGGVSEAFVSLVDLKTTYIRSDSEAEVFNNVEISVLFQTQEAPSEHRQKQWDDID